MKYPIYNRIAYAVLASVDWILERCIQPFIKKNAFIASPKHILLCNCAHLGDVILTTALLPVLKEAFPKAKIGILVGSWSQCVVDPHPLIDKIHVVDHWKVNRSKSTLFKKLYHYIRMRRHVLKEIKYVGYDVAIDCAFHFPNMAFLLWQTSIRMRIGFFSAGLSSFLTHAFAWDPLENRPAVEAFFSLLEPILKLEKYRNKLRPTLGIVKKTKKDFLVIHMGSGNPQKNWPSDKWRILIKMLEQDQESLVFTGIGEQENKEIEQVISGAGKAKNLCNELSWQAFSTLIQEAALLISVDTSAGHVAAAVDTPAVLLYTGIHPQKLWKPYGEHIKVLSYPVTCAPCLRGCNAMHCVRSISVDDVYAAVRSIKPRPTL